MTILSSALNKDNEIDQSGTIGRFVGGGDRESAPVPGEEIQVLVGGFLWDRGQTLTSPVPRKRRNIPPADERFPHVPIHHCSRAASSPISMCISQKKREREREKEKEKEREKRARESVCSRCKGRQQVTKLSLSFYVTDSQAERGREREREKESVLDLWS